MGVKDRLEEKSAGLGERPGPDAAAAPARGPRTAPGVLFAVREGMHEADAELARLRDLTARLEAGKPVIVADPRRVRWSAFANRQPQSFDTQEYKDLREQIRQAGGNVQPIKARPVKDDPAHDLEVVFGHRRHRACLDEGVPLNVIVVEMDDATMFAEMDRENRARSDLTPYEAAVHYRRALNQQLWPSMNQMAAEIGLARGHLSDLLALADLPPEVVRAFPNPLELQTRWGKVLNKQLAENRAGVIEKAEELSQERGQHSAKEVFLMLTCKDARHESHDVVVRGERLATIKRTGDRVSVAFATGVVTKQRIKGLHDALKRFLRETEKD